METFENKYSAWYLPLSTRHKQLIEQLSRVVLSFNGNLKRDVVRAKDKYNLKVRAVISEKTGVSLTFKTRGADEKENDCKEKAIIPMKIVDYVPVTLLELFETYGLDLIELLVHYRRMIITLHELEFQKEKYHEFSVYHNEECTYASLQDTIVHLNKLIEIVEKSGIIDAIRSLGPDIFGAYFPRDNRIELYWLSIGFGSILLDVPLEEFTLITLSHELTHGYTHIGFDKDGHNWDTKSFCSADLHIVEGFAQFYTEMLCKDYFENALDAFNSLITKQPSVYTSYKNWFTENETDKYEKARRILLKARALQTTKYIDFLHNLEIIKKDF